MRLTFLGGASEIGRLGCIIEHDGTRLLIDYGLAPTDPPKYPAPAPPVDGVFLTHAHLDHAGMMPALAHEHGASPYATPPSIDITEILAKDALKVHDLRGYGQPYSPRAPASFTKQARRIQYRRPIQVNSVEVTAWNAGHIPGSAMFAVTGSSTVVFTGDLNTGPTRLVEPAEPAPCHTLVMEGTYSGRDHKPRETTEREFLEAVDEIASNGGTVVVPAFAVGRTQEVLMVLDELDHPLHLDGMGSRVTDVFLRHGEYLRSSTAMRRAIDRTKVIRSRHDREAAVAPGHVIVTTSGMLEGGPVLYYASRLHDDPKSAFLLTGYQVEGTNGRRLLEERKLDIDGTIVDVNCRIEQHDFSAHAGHDELVAFAEASTPDTVIIMHSDDPGPLADDIRSFADVRVPEVGETVRV